MKIFISGLIAFLAAASIVAQEPGGNLGRAQERHEAKRDAYAAFRSGNATAAFAKMKASLRSSPSSRHADIQVADQLLEVVRWMLNERDPRAYEVATLALAETERARGTLALNDAAEMLVLQGHLYDLLGDRVQATARYEAALRIDRNKQAAQAALARYRQVDAVIEAKAREHAALRRAEGGS